MKDFFVSYTGSDEKYATWVAEILEEEKYSVIIQAWDFRPGDNFVSKIHESLRDCKKLILILSDSYLQSRWCEAEWTSKLAEEKSKNERKIIPIRIENINLHGLLKPVVYIDTVDKSEDEAKQLILDGVSDSKLRKSDGFPQPFNVEMMQIDNDYFVEAEKIVYYKYCKVKVLEGKKNKIHNRITWFADEEIIVTPLMSNLDIEELDIPDTNYNYNVVFSNVLSKGDVVEYAIKAELSNHQRHFENFFSTQIIAPVHKLNFHLHLPNNAATKIFTQKLSDSVMSARTEATIEKIFLPHFHWYIENPELHFEYKIFWQ
jgi:hypothetical protein